MFSRPGLIALVLVPGMVGGCAGDGSPAAAPDPRTVWEQVVEEARARAEGSYREPDRSASRTVSDLSYGQMRGIRFRSEEAVWRDGGPFQLQFFHPGGGFRTPVRIHLVEGGTTRTLPFDPRLFRYGDEVAGRQVELPPEAGFAGFRILSRMNDPDRWDEVVSFLGASYFRLLGPHQVYGVSARGVAVNVADPGGEEFPDFVEFWILRPAPGDPSITFFGLLDGPSLTGAYRFELTPGSGWPRGARAVPVQQEGTSAAAGSTVLSVEARLFARSDLRKLGMAPLTSMYLHGTFRPGGEDDVRPRVHDSEGLLMHTGRGEWIWRPLTNGGALRVTSLRDVDPRGFGLAQRDRDFDSYLDLEARYHERPSVWVEVEAGEWGAGGVELVEFPTGSEFRDNIVAYWSPDGAMRAGEERRFRYRLVTFGERLEGGDLPGGTVEGQSLGQVIRTRMGRDGLPGQVDRAPGDRRRVVVDFQGGSLDTLDPAVPVEAVISSSAGSVSDLRVELLPGGGRRATFALQPEGNRGADMRLFLVRDDRVLTETWSYLWEPRNGH